jgi:hypothetical protein
MKIENILNAVIVKTNNSHKKQENCSRAARGID